jgi:hypothetical protein
MQEGLAYQASLAAQTGPLDDEFLTVEALTLLVNQRMAREGMLGRCSNADVRSAIALATTDLFGLVSLASTNEVFIERTFT